MNRYDIAIVGAGPAGCMAAIMAGNFGSVALIERNDSVARKVLLTGKGRCNLTNDASMEEFIDKFGREGMFLRPAFSAFSNRNVVDFFESRGLRMKVERQGRIFPATDSAHSVVEVLKKCLTKNGAIDILYKHRIRDIYKNKSDFNLKAEGRETISAEKVILATGGVSYRKTGSSGDGFRIAGSFGHTISPLRATLVPLKTKEPWVRSLQGLSLKNIRVSFVAGGKKIKMSSNVGEMVFTHFGVSGPLILDMSGEITRLLRKFKNVNLRIDLKPGMSYEEVDKRLQREFKARGKAKLQTVMKTLLPHRLVDPLLRLALVDSDIEANQVTNRHRSSIKNVLKAFFMTIIGSLPIEEAMVTGGGVITKEINSRTMESRLVPGLYFAGELIDGSAKSGGYNLQQAFSTGCLAGRRAANA